MDWRLAFKLARQDLRGGIRQFTVLLACLCLGVTAISAIGSVRQAIESGLEDQAAQLLGGDAMVELTYRFADKTERAWLAEHSDQISEVVDFRSMAVVARGTEEERALTQVKAVDSAYPLLGHVDLSPPIDLKDAFAGEAGHPGGIMATALMDQLGLKVGDVFKLGVQDFVLMAEIRNEPDETGIGFRLGPRTIVLKDDLKASGLLEPGTLFETEYRLILPPDASLDALERDAEARFANAGLRWRDTRSGAPGVSRFVERLGRFLVLIGLTGLAVGGIGVASAVRTYLARKTEVIAILRSLGAESRTIFAIYFIQIFTVSSLGILLGVIFGGSLPLLLEPILKNSLPIPADIAIYPGPLAEAALYGILTALLFSLWPLSRTEQVRAAALFREQMGAARPLPRPRFIIATLILLILLVGLAALFSGNAVLTLWTSAGIFGALLLLAATGRGTRYLAARFRNTARRRPIWHWSLSAISAPGQTSQSVILSIGLGLSVLSAIGQIDGNLRSAIARDLPKIAPSYFFIDIQQTQLPEVLDLWAQNDDVNRIDTAPMLRGVITKINDQPAKDVVGDHWVVRGDRGVTYAATPDDRTTITQGAWWPNEYDGPPQISFSAEEAEEMGLSLGDTMVVNILGRDIEATITSFREVDFSTAGIGFVMVMNPASLRGAPHSHIATVYAEASAEAQILRDVARQYPNITAIRVRDAIENASTLLSGIAGAIRWGAMIALVTGVLVLVGAAAEGADTRRFEAAVLKTLGATRVQILASFALRAALLGAAAGIIALIAGSLGAYAVMRFVMEADFIVIWPSALIVIFAGVFASLLTNLGFAVQPLMTRPAQVLRSKE